MLRCVFGRGDLLGKRLVLTLRLPGPLLMVVRWFWPVPIVLQSHRQGDTPSKKTHCWCPVESLRPGRLCQLSEDGELDADAEFESCTVEFYAGLDR